MWEMSRTVGAVACLALIPAASEARARRPELSECFGVAMTPWDPDVLCVNNPDLVEEELSNNQDNFFFTMIIITSSGGQAVCPVCGVRHLARYRPTGYIRM